ncbi:hypothetical protein ACIPY2_10595 [Paenarthrobacter sp. NPDC089675]|uniref:hypothetical protein n=1 Tax=Paenarthrobacter sp. NPDC089675 TaxID=3364376 RepID=UPI0038164B4A
MRSPALSFVRISAVGALAAGLIAGLGAPAQAAPIPPSDPSIAPGNFSETNLAADRTAANFFYRIPALTYLANNVVLAAWDGRPGSAADAPNPNSIVQRRSTDGGRTWGAGTSHRRRARGRFNRPEVWLQRPLVCLRCRSQ